MSVLIINQGWTDNLGDIAIGEVLEKQMESFQPILIPFAPIEMATTGGPVRKILRLYQLDYRYKKNISATLDTINTPIKAAIIGGGELLASNANFNSAMKIWTRELQRRKIPILLLGVGGGNVNRLYAFRYAISLKRARMVCVRDNNSQHIVNTHYGVNALYYPDVVFTYGNMLNVRSKKLQRSKHRIMVNVLSFDEYKRRNKHESMDEYLQKWKKLIDEEMSEDTDIVFSATTCEDRDITQKLVETYFSGHADISFPETLEEFGAQLENVDCIITGRMHAMILALQKNVKCVPFIWRDKIEVFNEEYLCSSYDINSVVRDAQEGIDIVKHLIEKSELCNTSDSN